MISSPEFSIRSVSLIEHCRQNKEFTVFVGEVPDDYKAKVYRIDSSKKRLLINDTLGDNSILVIDSGSDNFVVSYSRKLDDRIMVFNTAGEIRDFPFIFIDDQTGSFWNLLGEAVNGPPNRK